MTTLPESDSAELHAALSRWSGTVRERAAALLLQEGYSPERALAAAAIGAAVPDVHRDLRGGGEVAVMAGTVAVVAVERLGLTAPGTAEAIRQLRRVVVPPRNVAERMRWRAFAEDFVREPLDEMRRQRHAADKVAPIVAMLRPTPGDKDNDASVLRPTTKRGAASTPQDHRCSLPRRPARSGRRSTPAAWP